MKGTIFELVQVDIETPEELNEKFSEMTPVLKDYNSICIGSYA